MENDLTMKVFRQILSISSKEELDSIEFGKLYHYKVQEDIMWSLGIRVIWYEINQDVENRHKELEKLIENLANSQYNYIDNNLERHTE